MSRYNYDRLVFDPVNTQNISNSNIKEDCYSEYDTSIRKNIPFKGEEEIEYVRHENYAFISSSHRDTTAYPLHYDYKIKFTNPYKNVKCVEMISVSIPNSTNILDEPVVVFDINEINHVDFLVNTTSNKIFCALPLNAPNKTTNGFIKIDASTSLNKSKLIFKNPISELSMLSIKIRDVDGAFLDFGVPNGSTTKSLQHSFVLKIITEEKSRKTISYRNVF
jgi:hypothetical protein